MTAQTNYFAAIDAQHPGVNNSVLQASPYVYEIPEAMADDDTTTITLPVGGTGRAPRIQVARHTGGDITNATPAATYVVSNGDTYDFMIDPEGDGVYRKVTHTLVGIASGGSATAIELAASINGDANLSPYILGVAGLTSNALTLFPITPRGKFYIAGGTQTGCLFAGTVVSQLNRTYVSQTIHIAAGTTGFSWSYVASTRVLTVKNETSGAVNRVQISVWT
jgi:hypothetical protein